MKRGQKPLAMPDEMLAEALRRTVAASAGRDLRELLSKIPVAIELQKEPESTGGVQVILRQVDYDGTILSSTPLGAS